MQKSYWYENGKYQKQWDRLIKLMPQSGNSHVLAGELIRAANKLCYDMYNNGMCNNTSGAINFLLKHGAISKELHSELHEDTRVAVYATLSGVKLSAMEDIIDSTIEYIMANPDSETAPNEDDIYNYTDTSLTRCRTCGVLFEEHSWYDDCDDCRDLDLEEDHWSEEVDDGEDW